MMRRNMLSLYGGNQHMLPVEGPVHDGMYAPMPFEGNMTYNPFGGGKQPFDPMPFDPGRGLPFPNPKQPFNPIPFGGNMGGQKGVPWWMGQFGGQFDPGLGPQNQGMQFGFPMRNNLMNFGGRRY